MGLRPGKDNVMFGRMRVTPILEVGADADLEAAITLLLRVSEQAEIVRDRISVVSFAVLVGTGGPESGSVYILDRKKGAVVLRRF